ncbi:MAG: sulfatase, partial [Actinomycetes bacterium]
MLAALTTTLGGLLVWVALIAPDDLTRLEPAAFVRIPVEALVVVALLAVLPPRIADVVAVLSGGALGLLALVKVLDLAFLAAFDRPFDPVADWAYAGAAVETLRGAVGGTGAVVAVAGVVTLAVAVLVLVPLSLVRVGRLAAGQRRRSLRTLTAVAAVWMICAVLGVHVVAGVPVASAGAAGLASDKTRAWWTQLHDQRRFAAALRDDRFRSRQGDQLLTALRGKDVLLVFVESYGRVALEDPTISPGVHATLDAGTDGLEKAGFSSRSAWLTSPTFGGISWLAHSTLQSGAWVDSQDRYDQLVASDRFTLSQAFKRAGWRTVGDVPSNDRYWPQGSSFYRYDHVYDRRNVGYVGPAFAYASMPDQYVLSAFHRLELSKPARRPVFAEIDLVSSHTPWTELPETVPWDDVGDGSVFDSMPVQSQSKRALLRDPGAVRSAYGRSSQYSLTALLSFVERYGDDDLVLVVLGDHQPAAVVTGPDAGHDVPVSFIASDPAVLDRISGWGWRDGMRPDGDTPVWRMDAFR